MLLVVLVASSLALPAPATSHVTSPVTPASTESQPVAYYKPPSRANTSRNWRVKQATFESGLVPPANRAITKAPYVLPFSTGSAATLSKSWREPAANAESAANPVAVLPPSAAVNWRKPATDLTVSPIVESPALAALSGSHVEPVINSKLAVETVAESPASPAPADGKLRAAAAQSPKTKEDAKSPSLGWFGSIAAVLFPK